MQATVNWETTAKQVEKEFAALSNDRGLVEAALENLRAWLEEPIYRPFRAAVFSHIAGVQYTLLLDSFYQLLPFGTGGRRGRVGFGPNRINEVTVAMSVQGHCNYLRKQYPNQALNLVVAFDTRMFTDIAGAYHFLGKENPLIGLSSRKLARIACEIYAANGYPVWVPGLAANSTYLSTPELSFAIRHLQAIGGINVSASHNHPDDNGFKFFNHEGAQDVPPTDQYLTSFMENVAEVKRIAFDEGVTKGLIRDVPPELHQVYIETNLNLRSKQGGPAVHVMYTPLCGTGDATVGDVLRAAGHQVDLYAPQANFDGSFASVPFRLPNPEVREVMDPALAEAKAKNADVLLSTDPDADRLGVYARARDGSWRYLNGNEIASVLTYYLVADERGPRRKGIIIKTLVTTRMMEGIAEKGGCQIVADLLVGFKYIAYVLGELEREGRYGNVHGQATDLVIAGEESHGVLLTPTIRDKDAAGGAVVLCELLSQLKAANQALPEYLQALADDCGNYVNLARSVVMRGIRGAQLLATMMKSLRDDPPRRFGDYEVRDCQDFLSEKHGGPLRSDTDRLSRNLLLFRLDAAQITIRPSGTEPKAKIYVDLEGRKLPDRSKATTAGGELAASVMAQCIERVGFKLSESANLLPDYVDLDLKAAFDAEFRAALLNAAEALGKQNDAARLKWLRDRLAAYGAGADPLESTSKAVAHLCEVLRRESANPAVQQGLAALTALLRPAS